MDDLIRSIRQAPPQPIPDKMGTVEGMIEIARDHAERVLVGSAKAEIMPAWCVLSANGHASIIATPFIGEESKEMVAQTMRVLMREVGAIRYTLVTEAWLATQERGTDDRRPPAQRDDRIEVVMILGSDRAGTRGESYEIVRDWDSGVVTELRPHGQMDAKGRFSDLLEDD